MTIPACKPTKAELSAIRNGEAAIARGEHVSLAEFLSFTKVLRDLEHPRRKAGTKATREVSR